MLKPEVTYEPLGFKRLCGYSSTPAVLHTGVVSSLILERNILDSAWKNSVRNVSLVGGIFHDHTSPGQQLRTHIQTDGNDIRPHTTQTINEHTSAASSLVTAQSTACALPEDGRIGRPKHVGATSPKCFNKILSVLNINPLNAELNPICCLLALLGAHHFLHVSRIRVNVN